MVIEGGLSRKLSTPLSRNTEKLQMIWNITTTTHAQEEPRHVVFIT